MFLQKCISRFIPNCFLSELPMACLLFLRYDVSYFSMVLIHKCLHTVSSPPKQGRKNYTVYYIKTSYTQPENIKYIHVTNILATSTHILTW